MAIILYAYGTLDALTKYCQTFFRVILCSRNNQNAITNKAILPANEINDKIKEQKAVAIFDSNR
jgi:hypothetical protein